MGQTQRKVQVDTRELRQAFSRFGTGVTVMTTRHTPLSRIERKK